MKMIMLSELGGPHRKEIINISFGKINNMWPLLYKHLDIYCALELKVVATSGYYSEYNEKMDGKVR